MQNNISINNFSSEDFDAAHESLIKLCNSGGIQKLVSLVFNEIKEKRFADDAGFVDIMNIAKKVTSNITPELKNEIMSDDTNIAKLSNMIINNNVNNTHTTNQLIGKVETNKEEPIQNDDGEIMNIQI